MPGKESIFYMHKKGRYVPEDRFIKIIMPKESDKFGCVDYATGIEDLNQFTKLFESSKQGETLTAGEFGIGRISCFGVTVNIDGWLEYITNNGDVERVIIVDPTGLDEHDPVSCNNGRLKRRGCCVFVHKVNASLLPTQKELVKYLSGTFGLRIMRDPKLRLWVNDEQVGINKELETFKKIITIAEFDYNGQKVTIEGNIQSYQSGTGSLWVYKKDIRIGNNMKDFGLDYRVKGWINCNSFELTSGRDDVIEDDLYNLIRKYIEQYLEKGNFKKIDKDGDDQISPQKSRNLITKMSGYVRINVI